MELELKGCVCLEAKGRTEGSHTASLGRRAGSMSRRLEVKPLERVGSSLLNCGGGGSTYHLEGNRDPLISLSRKMTEIDLSFRLPDPEQALESWKKQSGDNWACPVE